MLLKGKDEGLCLLDNAMPPKKADRFEPTAYSIIHSEDSTEYADNILNAWHTN